jgi:hypothetical protein
MADTRNIPTQAPATSPAPTPAAPTATEALLAQTLAALAQSNERITGLMEQQAAYNKAALKIAPRRKKSMGEYLAVRKQKGISKFLPHLVYQNGRLVNPAGLAQETINTLDTLASGHYCDGLLDVVRVSDGVDGVNSRIHLCYNNRTVEERMFFYMRFPSFTKIVTDIAAEMKARNIAPVIEKGMDPPEFEFPDELKELI